MGESRGSFGSRIDKESLLQSRTFNHSEKVRVRVSTEHSSDFSTRASTLDLGLG